MKKNVNEVTAAQRYALMSPTPTLATTTTATTTSSDPASIEPISDADAVKSPLQSPKAKNED